SRLQYLTLNPVVAWKPFETLSVAVGPTFNYSQAELRQGVPLPPFLPPAELRFKGSDWAYGFDAGILWQPHPKWSFGAKYMSATTMDYDGPASFSPPAPYFPPDTHTKAHLNFPQIIAGGVSFRPTTNWNVEFDV